VRPQRGSRTKKALERLVMIAGGTTWEAEMDHLSAQKEADLEKVHGKASTESTGRLF
jgi:transcriptional antiterminator Rof (Rho-off)